MIFCRHHYVLEKETLVPSFIERSGMRSNFECPASLAAGTHIQVFRCKKCQKMKRFSEKV